MVSAQTVIPTNRLWISNYRRNINGSISRNWHHKRLRQVLNHIENTGIPPLWCLPHLDRNIRHLPINRIKSSTFIQLSSTLRLSLDENRPFWTHGYGSIASLLT